jgi:hypothetical protein
MDLYQFPTMRIRDGGHDPPNDDFAVEDIRKVLKATWKNKYAKPLILED